MEKLAGGDEKTVIKDMLSNLPSHVVNHLSSIGVCTWCIIRLFSIHDGVYSHAPLSSSTIEFKEILVTGSTEKEDVNDMNSFRASETKSSFCTLCLGVMQFTYLDQEEMLVKRDCADDFALIIADNVKRERHEITEFSLEVSLPSLITENEEKIWSYVIDSYGLDVWFQERFSSLPLSVKDFLKLLITNPLETLLGAKSGGSSFRIRLTFDHVHASTMVQNVKEKEQCHKRIKTNYDLDSAVRSTNSDIEYHGYSFKGNGLSKSYITLQGGMIYGCSTLLEKVYQPCKMTFQCYRTPIYIGGRYLKYSRNVSQSRWIIDDERIGEASVEEIIGNNILPVCHGDSYKFHAAGREDIDVRMLGSGRPFLVEIQNARHVPSEVSIKEIEGKINGLESKLVRVKNVKLLGSEAWTLMREGEAEKQKEYAALVWISRSVKDEDLQTISSLNDLQICQRTPIRVLHRRSPLERERIIHWMKIERIAGSTQYFFIHLCTQAGTYIKEFVHGDLGRTHPSIGSILGCRAEILQLDVTDVKMDCFLSES